MQSCCGAAAAPYVQTGTVRRCPGYRVMSLGASVSGKEVDEVGRSLDMDMKKEDEIWEGTDRPSSGESGSLVLIFSMILLSV